jgi:hypothetical protein
MEKRGFIRILWLFALFACISSCSVTSCKENPEEKKVRSVLLYISANNNLYSYAEECIQDIKKGYVPQYKDQNNILLVFYHVPGKTPTLSRYSCNKDGVVLCETICIYEQEMNSSQISSFSRVVADAERTYPATDHGLILWSHATGWLPEGYYANPLDMAGDKSSQPFEDPYRFLVKSPTEEPPQKSFGSDNNSEMEITELAAALPHNYEFILFDCCLMGGIEVAYEFKDKCEYMLFSPTEILADGFPYEKMFAPIFNVENREEALKQVCSDYFAIYDAQTGIYRSATVSMVRCSALDNLAGVCASIYRNNQDSIFAMDDSKLQIYYRYDKKWYYDFEDIVSRIATPAQYAEFKTSLNGAIVYKATTDIFLNITIERYSGLSTYLPRAQYKVLNNFYKTLKWNIATGYVK